MRLQEYTLVGVIIVLLVVGTILKPDTFPTTDNFRAMLTQASVVGVLAIGMTFVIATSGIDLSVGSIVAAAGVAGGLLIDSGDVGVRRSARSASGCCSARSTPPPSPSARSCPSSPRWPCSPSPAAWRCR